MGNKAIVDVTAQVDVAIFEKTFHASPDQLSLLVQQKTVTLPQLLEICGPSVVDPTPFLYTQGVGICALCQVGALLTNAALTRPNIEAPTKAHDEQDKEDDTLKKAGDN